MPKGRQYCNWETTSMNGTWSVIRNAPFGTSYTPGTARLKIMDGKMVSVDDNDEQKLVNSRTHSETPPVAQELSKLPPVESQHLSQTVASHPRFGDTKNREALAELQLPENDDDGNYSGVDLPRQVGRHHILPPIGLNPSNGRSHNLVASGDSATEALNNESVFRQTIGPSDHPAPLSRSEEVDILARRVREELTNFSANQLKYIYLKMVEIDTNMTGYISFRDIQDIFHQSKVCLSPATLRLIAKMFLSVYRSNLVNYEGLVSFIAKSVQTSPDSENRELTSTAALRRIVEKQLLAGGCCLEFENIWNYFQWADRSRRDRLSRNQIKRLAAACHLPLSEFVVDQVLNRCSSTSDRYSWQDFLGYVEHVYPMKTSITIPPTYRRVKELPDVGSEWPDPEITPRARFSELPLDEELSALGTIVQEIRKRLNDERRDGNYVFKPWFERFMLMAKAFYSFDQSNSGLMNVSVARWIIQEYNRTYNLGLNEGKVDLTMKTYTEGDKVATEPFLKTLVAQGP